MRFLSSPKFLISALSCIRSVAFAAEVKSESQHERSWRRQVRQSSTFRELEEAPLQAYETSADLMAANIAGPGVTILSSSFQGRSVQAGLFSGGTEIVGLSSGSILSTGNIEEISGPNDGKFSRTKFDEAGFDALTDLTGNSTHDAAVLTVRFKCKPGRRFSLTYIFGSEDYNPSNEGYAWEDVMGIFLNGLRPKDNIATVEGSYVSVKTINCSPDNPHCRYFVKNNNLATEMSGFTKVLKAEGTILTDTNILTIAIADGFDGNYPSWLLLGQGSMTCSSVKDTAPSPSPDTSPSNGKDNEDKGEEGIVTKAGPCFKTLTKKCPCSRVFKLKRCVKKQIESNCVPPTADKERNVYIKKLTKRYRKLHCS